MATLTAINQQSVTDLVALSPTYAKEILWMGDIAMDRERYNPFVDLMGGAGGCHPIKEVGNTSKVRGNTIVITQEADYGGKGISGDNTLLGNEEERKYSQFAVTIGWHRHAIAESKQAKQGTFIGSTFDKSVRAGLRRWASRLKADCIEATMHAEATALNRIFAGNRADKDKLGSNDVMTLQTIRQAKLLAGGIGCREIEIAKAEGNQRILKYYLQGCDWLMDGMVNSGRWETLLATAGERGPKHYLFGGHLPEVDGVILNNWTISMTSADAAQGAFCSPRAHLGVAITADNTAPLIKGGGYNGNATLTTNAVAKTLNDYMRYFPLAPFNAFDRDIIAAGSGTAFLLIMNTSGSDAGKFGFYAYTACDGKTIQTTKRLRATASGDAEATLTGSTISWTSGPWVGLTTDAHPIGSLIVPCNSKGQPYVHGYLFGNDAILCGYGSIDGTPSGAFGKRITEDNDYGKNKGIGVELVWGVKAMENAAKIVNGYVLITGAYNLPGMPEIDGG